METATGSTRVNLIHQRQLDLNQEGSVVDLQPIDCGKKLSLVTKYFSNNVLYIFNLLICRKPVSFGLCNSNGIGNRMGFT